MDKWYEEDQKERAKEDQLVEKELANRFRREGLKSTPETVEFLRIFEQAALSNMFYEGEIRRTVQVSEESLKSFYNAHTDKFLQKEEVDLGHIFVEIPPDSTPDQLALKEKKINHALEDIENGISFEETAKKYSEAESASQGGKAGRLPKGKAPQSIEQIAFSMKPGETSPIIKTEHGYHILKVYRHYPERIPGFEEVKEKLERQVRQNMEREKIQSLISARVGADQIVSSFHSERLDNAASGTILVEWNGMKYSYNDLKQRAKRFGPPPPSPGEWKTLWPLFLQREILALEAEKRGYREEEAFKIMSRWVENYLLCEQYLKIKIDPFVTVPEEEKKAFYTENKGLYIEQEKSMGMVVEQDLELSGNQVKRHREIQEAKKLLAERFQKAETREEFQRMAEEFKREKGALIHLYDTGLIIAAAKGRIYDTVMEHLKPGQKSEPVECDQGIMMIFCVEKKPLRYLDYKEAKNLAEKDLLVKKRLLKRSEFRRMILQKKDPALS